MPHPPLSPQSPLSNRYIHWCPELQVGRLLHLHRRRPHHAYRGGDLLPHCPRPHRRHRATKKDEEGGSPPCRPGGCHGAERAGWVGAGEGDLAGRLSGWRGSSEGSGSVWRAPKRAEKVHRYATDAGVPFCTLDNPAILSPPSAQTCRAPLPTRLLPSLRHVGRRVGEYQSGMSLFRSLPGPPIRRISRPPPPHPCPAAPPPPGASTSSRDPHPPPLLLSTDACCNPPPPPLRGRREGGGDDGRWAGVQPGERLAVHRGRSGWQSRA